MQIYQVVNFIVLSFIMTGLGSLSFNSRLRFSILLFVLQTPIFLAYVVQFARTYQIASINPLEIFLIKPQIIGLTYFLALISVLYLCLYLYSEVMDLRGDKIFKYLFQERESSDNEEEPKRLQQHVQRSLQRSHSRFLWPRNTKNTTKFTKVSPRLYDDDPAAYTTRRVQELAKYQQFSDMKNNVIPSRWQGTIPEPTEAQKARWLEEFAGRRDLLSDEENVFAENAYDPPNVMKAVEKPVVRRFNTMHNPRVTSKLLFQGGSSSHFKHD